MKCSAVHLVAIALSTLLLFSSAHAGYLDDATVTVYSLEPSGDWVFRGNGALVAPDTFLIAGHAVRAVMPSRLNIWATDGWHGVSQVSVHPQYGFGPGAYPNDIAVVQLQTPVSSAIVLELAEHPHPGETGYLIPYAELPNAPGSAVQLITNAEAAQYWGSYITAGHVCLFADIPVSHTIPVVVQEQGAWKVHGVMSWGHPTSLTWPMVASSVLHYRPWLQTMIEWLRRPLLCLDAVEAYPAGGWPWEIAVGDLDGDLDLDLVVTSQQATISILLNDGDGTFDPYVSYPAGERTLGIAIGDLDGDGDLDLAVANHLDNDVSIFLNDGDGTFDPHETYGVGGRPWSVAIGDLDGDLDLDLAVANSDGDGALEDGGTSILLNNGDGTFASHDSYLSGGGPVSIELGDLDGDLDLDVAVAAREGVSVLLNDGDGTFDPYVSYPAGEGLIDVVLGDLDGDLDVDLAVASQSSDDVSVLLNNGDGTFADAVSYAVGAGWHFLAIDDLDGDNDLDLVVSSGATSVLFNDGNGTFTGAAYDVGMPGLHVAIGDLDGDLDLDLAAVHGYSVRLAFFSRSRCP